MMSSVDPLTPFGNFERALKGRFDHNVLPVTPYDAKTILRSPGKTPGLREKNGTWAGFPGWQKEQETTPERAREFDAWGAAMGFRGGVRGLLGIDFDITDRALLKLVKAQFMSLLPPELWENFPERGVDHPDHVKTLLACMTVDDNGKSLPVSSTDIHFFQPDGQPGQVQMISSGRYFNVLGTHPVRQVPYSWNVDILKVGLLGLPRVPVSTIEHFLDELPNILELAGAAVISGAKPMAAGSRVIERCTIPELKSWLALLPNDKTFSLRTPWLAMCAAIWNATNGSQEGKEVWLEWCEQVTQGDPDEPERVWDTMSNPQADVGSLRKWAASRGHTQEIAKTVFEVVDDGTVPPPSAAVKAKTLQGLYDEFASARPTPTEY